MSYKKVLKQIKENNDLQKGSLQRKLGNPKKQLTNPEKSTMGSWATENYDGTARESIPHANLQASKRFAHKLNSQTEVRKHPKTGERMFLMHRGVHPTEKDFHEKGELSSWTPKKTIAHFFAKDHVGNSG